MSFLLKKNIHSSLAKAFYSDILSQRNMYYYFLGRTIEWNADDIPPSIDDTLVEESDIRNNIVYMTKITPNNISYIIPRHNWTMGVVYDKYNPNISVTSPAPSGATHIKDSRFYVLTPEMNVYKCIDNNFNSPSTVIPDGIEYDIIKTADGYLWKYMYSIPQTLQYKFLTDTHIPVFSALNLKYYDRRGIDTVTIQNGGSGYEGAPVAYAVVDGDGTGAEVGLSISPVDGRIARARIKNQGSGYTTGTITVFTLDGKGSGRYGNPTAILTPKFISGKLVDVIVEDPGIGYSTDVQTNIIVEGNGKGAKLTPVVENGVVVDVIVEDSGHDYTDVQLTVMGATGSGAVLEASTSIGDVDSIQADVELLATPGTIYSVDVKEAGKGYTFTRCDVQGDGTGLTVEATLSGGGILRFNVITPGSGYTWCKIVVVGDGSGAEALPIISPAKGHGFNAVDELFADSLSIYQAIKFSNNQPFFLNNDYRQFGIIRNPEQWMQTALYRDLVSSPCFVITTENIDQLHADMELSLSGDDTKRFNVVGVDYINNRIMVQTKGVFNILPGSYLIDVNDANNKFRINTVQPPDINKMSGEMIYVDNRTAIYQTSTQFVSLRTTIKF